jgi:queuine tRNA-ribosyltransferase
VNGSHEIIRTRGGALAVRSVAEGEVMHPGVGPLVEAEQLYVGQSRLAERLHESGKLVLFDVGLGAGSNALAAWQASEKSSAGRLHLVSFERDLGALELALAHADEFGITDGAAHAVRALLRDGCHESSRTTWRLHHGDALEALAREEEPADIVFWDPFSPKHNPALWTVAAFAALREKAGPRCTLFTYSASTATRVALLLAGWYVGVGDSIGTKAETTAAACDARDVVRPLDSTWLRRVARADAPLPSDAPSDAAAHVAQLPQFKVG